MIALLFILLSLATLVGAAPPGRPQPDHRPDYIKSLEDWDVSKVQSPVPPADPGGFFGMSGQVEIRDTKLSINGDLHLILADEHGVCLVVQRTVSFLKPPAAEDGFIKVSFPGRIQGQYLLPPDGREAEALLLLIRQASIFTFGPGPFAPNDKARFSRMAVDRVLGYLTK